MNATRNRAECRVSAGRCVESSRRGGTARVFFFLRRRWFSGLSARLNGFGWVRRTIWKKKTQTKKRIKDTETSVMEIHGLLLLRHHRWRWWTWVIAWISSLIAAMGIELFPIFPKQLGMNRNRHSEHHRGIKVKSIWFPYLEKTNGPRLVNEWHGITYDDFWFGFLMKKVWMNCPLVSLFPWFSFVCFPPLFPKKKQGLDNFLPFTPQYIDDIYLFWPG